jgi:hypothetical protein
MRLPAVERSIASKTSWPDSANNAELDALLIHHEGELRARSYNNEATLERARGSSAKTSGYFSAAGTLGVGVGGRVPPPKTGAEG